VRDRAVHRRHEPAPGLRRRAGGRAPVSVGPRPQRPSAAAPATAGKAHGSGVRSRTPPCTRAARERRLRSARAQGRTGRRENPLHSPA
jgi:hypothetical protein